MLQFSEEQFRQTVRVDDVIRRIRAAFIRGFADVRMPLRSLLEMNDAVLLLMPCYDSAANAAGVKLVSVSKKAGVHAVYELLDPTTGTTLARFEANYLTDLRTAATSAVATDLLARKDAETLGVFGCGRQAMAHLAVLPRVRDFKRFLVCGSGRSDLNAFRAKMKSQHGIHIETVDAEVCARESDVICTCTTAQEPLFNGEDLRPGTHLNLVGGFQPHSREVDDATVTRARIVVDTYEGALSEAGDLLIPIRQKVLDLAQVVADLHEIASGKKAGRIHQDAITVFKSVGCAVEDLVTAQSVYEQVQHNQPPVPAVSRS